MAGCWHAIMVQEETMKDKGLISSILILEIMEGTMETKNLRGDLANLDILE